jgi:hypothetical protein
MISIDSSSPDAGRPWLNLAPIIQFMVDAGNRTLDGGFIQYPDGWRCRMSEPLNLEGIRRNFELPSTIILSDGHDSVLDKKSWCVIEGPGAHTSLPT